MAIVIINVNAVERHIRSDKYSGIRIVMHKTLKNAEVYVAPFTAKNKQMLDEFVAAVKTLDQELVTVQPFIVS